MGRDEQEGKGEGRYSAREIALHIIMLDFQYLRVLAIDNGPFISVARTVWVVKSKEQLRDLC
jgi:hypothetical protein